ncbi:hypothetical protein BMS3Bbin11_01517 [bacterium BMS3Bbin11]|nr:hypothetical protein BMS3Bbin11_01517 [bacterium BMS3Bbin11]
MPACRHPVDVTAQGIDFTIVRDHAERLCQIPGREGIGREALMHQCQRGLHACVIKVFIKGADLVSQQHTFI